MRVGVRGRRSIGFIGAVRALLHAIPFCGPSNIASFQIETTGIADHRTGWGAPPEWSAFRSAIAKNRQSQFPPPNHIKFKKPTCTNDRERTCLSGPWEMFCPVLHPIVRRPIGLLLPVHDSAEDSPTLSPRDFPHIVEPDVRDPPAQTRSAAEQRPSPPRMVVAWDHWSRDEKSVPFPFVEWTLTLPPRRRPGISSAGLLRPEEGGRASKTQLRRADFQERNGGSEEKVNAKWT